MSVSISASLWSLTEACVVLVESVDDGLGGVARVVPASIVWTAEAACGSAS